MVDPVRGRVMLRLPRASGYGYIARAILADGRYVEAAFLTPDYIEEGVGVISPGSFVDIKSGRPAYELLSYLVLIKLESSARPPDEAHRRQAQKHARALGVRVDFVLADYGRWVVVVTTRRGDYEIAHLPGENWENVLREAGLGKDMLDP